MATLEQQLKPLFKAGAELKSGTFAKGVHRIAARPLQAEAIRQIERGIGTDRQLRNFPRPGRKVRQYARYDFKGDELWLAFVPSGMSTIIEYPTRHAPIATPIANTARQAPAMWQEALIRRWSRVVR